VHPAAADRDAVGADAVGVGDDVLDLIEVAADVCHVGRVPEPGAVAPAALWW
jgi:hypothetical protein